MEVFGSFYNYYYIQNVDLMVRSPGAADALVLPAPASAPPLCHRPQLVGSYAYLAQRDNLSAFIRFRNLCARQAGTVAGAGEGARVAQLCL